MTGRVEKKNFWQQLGTDWSRLNADPKTRAPRFATEVVSFGRGEAKALLALDLDLEANAAATMTFAQHSRRSKACIEMDLSLELRPRKNEPKSWIDCDITMNTNYSNPAVLPPHVLELGATHPPANEVTR